MTFNVTAALDAHVERLSPPSEPDGKWHPSAMFGCARKAIYELRGIEQSDPRDTRSKRVLFVGSRWHEIVQAAVEDSPLLDEVYTEVRIDVPELNITGHADQLVRRGDRWEMEEFKSISSRGFSFLKGEPKPEHIEQAMVYLWALRTKGVECPDHDPELGCERACVNLPSLGDALDRVRFVYISKDDLRIAEFVVHWTPEWEQRIRDRVALLDGFRHDPIALPARLPLENGKRNWLCKSYCEFRTRCWDFDPGVIEPTGVGTAVAAVA